MTSHDEDGEWDYIQLAIRDKPLETELTWSLFVAALYSYRYDSLVRPFPPMFLKDNGDKDFKSLETYVEAVPPFRQILDKPTDVVFPKKSLKLLKWVLENKSFTLMNADSSQFDSIKSLTKDSGVSAVDPNLVFEVIYDENSVAKYEELRDGRELLYAYHGSRIENFYSILHNGLASHMNKVSVFGEGTYLSSELSVSLHYSPLGRGWEHCQFGNQLSCIAVCEIIDDPKSVKCKVKDDNQNVRSRAANSEAGDVPEKYYVVQNNDVIRLKYLLLYAKKTQRINTSSSKLKGWLFRHKFALMMIAYFLILLIVGLANSKTFWYYVKRIKSSKFPW